MTWHGCIFTRYPFKLIKVSRHNVEKDVHCSVDDIVANFFVTNDALPFDLSKGDAVKMVITIFDAFAITE